MGDQGGLVVAVEAAAVVDPAVGAFDPPTCGGCTMNLAIGAQAVSDRSES